MSKWSRRNLFLLLCAVALLQTGAHMSQSFVNYPAWHLIDSGSFPAYHWAISIRAGAFLLVPRIVEIVVGLTVLRFRPQVIGGWVLLLGIGLALGALLSTVLIQRPIHRELDIQSNTPDFAVPFDGDGLDPELTRIRARRTLPGGTVTTHSAPRAA